MSCYKPLKGFRTPSGVVFSELGRFDILGDIEIPCGQCQGCRLRRAGDWAVRIMHEASLWPDNSFITLTYARDQLPADGSLFHRDFQLFMKRMRKRRDVDVRYFMAGEYGELTSRAHYHACLFNEAFRSDRVPHAKSETGHWCYTQPLLSELWPHGIATVQELTKETAGYCARYLMTKRMGPGKEAAYVTPDGVIRQEEYAAMSLKPGIGYYWYQLFGKEVHPRDCVLLDGSRLPVPKYYDKLFRRTGNVVMDSVEFKREQRAKLSVADQTDERRAVRAKVANARVSKLKRSL